MPAEQRPERTRVLVVAADALEWSVILPMLEAGELPTFRRWLATGSGGYLETMSPTKSPVIWTTVATGKSPEHHGIVDFIRRDDDGEPRLLTARDRRTAALWNMASALEVPTAVIGWWMTWPVEPVYGVMVAQTNTLPGEGASGGVWKGSVLEGTPDQVWPPERTAEVLDALRDVDEHFDETTRAIFEPVPAGLPEAEAVMWDGTRWALRADAVYLRTAEELLTTDDFRLAMLYLGGADVIGHRFWRYYRPGKFDHPPGEAELEKLGGLVEDYYRHLDRALGRLTAGMQDWNVLLISDHGMEAQRTDSTFDPSDGLGRLTSGYHRQGPPGVLIAAGPQIRRATDADWSAPMETAKLPVLGSIMDIAPTVLALLGLPVARDLEGQVLEPLLALDRASTPEPIETYDAFARPAWGDTEARSKTEAERLQQLRALGYIGR